MCVDASEREMISPQLLETMRVETRLRETHGDLRRLTKTSCWWSLRAPRKSLSVSRRLLCQRQRETDRDFVSSYRASTMINQTERVLSSFDCFPALSVAYLFGSLWCVHPGHLKQRRGALVTAVPRLPLEGVAASTRGLTVYFHTRV